MGAPRFRLARQVTADLVEISDYLDERSPSAANRVIDELFRAFDSLADEPELGMSLDDIRPNLRMLVPRKPASKYLIFYYLVPDGVLISAIIHGSRDWIGMFARGER